MCADTAIQICEADDRPLRCPFCSQEREWTTIIIDEEDEVCHCLECGQSGPLATFTI